MKRSECTKCIWPSTSGAAARRPRTCQLLAALLMAVVASPMAGFALQMQGPAMLAAIFGSGSESEEDASTDASEYAEMLNRPRDRSRRFDTRSTRQSVSDRLLPDLAREMRRVGHSATEHVLLAREIPLRC